MPASSTQVHGYHGDLKAGGTQIAITEWSGDHGNDIKEGTTTANNGFKSWVKGLESMSGSFKCIWDTLANPYLINIVPGTIVALELYINGTSHYAFQAMLKGVSISSPVQDLVTYTVQFESHGEITYPN